MRHRAGSRAPAHEVDGCKITFIIPHCLVCLRLCPVSLNRCHNLHVRLLQGIGESLVTFLCRRRTFQSQYLHHTPFPIEPVDDIAAHLAPHLIVVGTDEGRIFVGVGLPFKHDDGNTFVEGTVDGRGYRRSLVGSHNQQVDAALNKIAYLLALQFGIVMGRGKAQLHTFVEVGLHLHLRVLPVAPDILRALGYTYNIFGAFPGT